MHLSRMNQGITVFTLASWGLIFLAIAVAGKLRFLLYPLFWPLEITAGFLLVVLAVATRVCFQPGGGKNQGIYPVLGPFLAVILVLAALLSAPNSLSANLLDQRGKWSGSRILVQMSKAQSSEKELTLVDFATAIYYPDKITSVTGRKVIFLGQYFHGSNGEFRFCRVLMSCCAADATPIYLHITGPAPAVADLDWIQVEGETFFRQGDEGLLPCLKLIRATRAQAPPDPYLYAVRLK